MYRLFSFCMALLCAAALVLPANGQSGEPDRAARTMRAEQGTPHKVFVPYVSYDNMSTTQIASVGPDVQFGNKDSSLPGLSANGRYVVFASEATNLVPGDTNNKSDIFLVDRTQNTITLVSLASDGTHANGTSSRPSVSTDGRYVAFLSTASNLVSGDTNAKQDVFVRDVQAATTSLVSLATNGTQTNSASYNARISGNGRYVVYETSATTLAANDTNATTDVYLYDRQLGQSELISLSTGGTAGNDSSTIPSISSDGRYVAFQSNASNLVATDHNATTDAFVRDRQAGSTSLVSLSSGGVQGNAGSGYATLTDDGRYVAFVSNASNLVSGDSNNVMDLFVRDCQAGTTVRASLSNSAEQANDDTTIGQIAAGGRYVVFWSAASNLVGGDTNGKDDIFIRDLQSATSTRLSLSTAGEQANNDSSYPAISGDGTLVAFQSIANNLVSGDIGSVDGIFLTGSDVFVRDRTANQTSVVSRLYAPAQSTANSATASVSDDGRYVAFASASVTLVVPSDGVGTHTKIFVRDMQTRTAIIASVSPTGTIGVGNSTTPSLSGDGKMVAFASDATILVSDDTNGAGDVFVRNLTSAQTTRVSVSTAGTQGNDLSWGPRLARNGQFVCFTSSATNLVGNDSNGKPDIFVRSLAGGTTERVSLSSAGVEGGGYNNNCAISADGRYVAFQSTSTNLVANDTNGVQDIFVHDRQTHTTSLVSRGLSGAQSNGDSYAPSISDDGQTIAFDSAASNLVTGDTNASRDVFIYSVAAGTTVRASLSSAGGEGNGSSYAASLSGNGSHVAFESVAHNLITAATSNNQVYVRNLVTGRTSLLNVSSQDVTGNNASWAPAISGTGRYVAFQSAASNLVSGDSNGYVDIFLRNRGNNY